MYLVFHKRHQRDTYTGLVDMALGKRKASALDCHESAVQLETLEEGKEKPGVAISEDGQQADLAHLSRARAYIP